MHQRSGKALAHFYRIPQAQCRQRVSESLVTVVVAKGDAIVNIRVIPRARRSGIDGMRGDAILVRLKSAPADGAANAELIDVISDALDVPKRSVTIIAGEKSRLKRVRVAGLDDATAHARPAASRIRHVKAAAAP